MADVTVDELELGDDVGFLDRVLPWRRRRLVQKRAVEARLDRMAETVNGIRKDHGLDDLMIDIERARARGEAAMEATEHDRTKAKEQEDPPPQRQRLGSRP